MNEAIIVALIGIFGIFIGAMIERNTSARKNYMEHIIKERKNWRDKIRLLTVDLYSSDSDYREIKTEYQIRLNPRDRKDNIILDYLDKIIELDKRSISIKDKKIIERYKSIIASEVSMLLKHDWERVKDETSVFKFNPIQVILGLIYWSISLITFKLDFYHIDTNSLNIIWFVSCKLILYIILYYFIKYILKEMENNEMCKGLFKFFGLTFRYSSEKSNYEE